MNRREFLAAGSAAFLLPACTTLRPQLKAEAGWTRLPTVPFRGKQDDIAFATPRHGFYGNGEGRLYATADGGDSWTQIWHRPGTYIRALGFLNEQEGVLGNVGPDIYPPGTDDTPLYWTADGGRSWHPAEVRGPRPAGICGIDVRPRSGTVHAAGRVGGPAFYLRSTDGRHFDSRDLSPLARAAFDVKFIDDDVGFIAAATDTDPSRMYGSILRTDDGGESWREVFRSRRLFETVWKIHFPTRRTGFASIQNYDPDPASSPRFVARTTDSGLTWTELPLIDNHKWRSFGIGFASEDLGWAGGSTGGLETRDGGRSWTSVELGKAVNKFRFVGRGRERRAYAIGTDIYRLDLA